MTRRNFLKYSGSLAALAALAPTELLGGVADSPVIFDYDNKIIRLSDKIQSISIEELHEYLRKGWQDTIVDYNSYELTLTSGYYVNLDDVQKLTIRSF